MKVVSVNIGERKGVKYRGKTVQTGVFKKPVTHPIILGKFDVEGDAVIDRRYHGGEFKACYLYSADHYEFWKNKYPDLEWEYGMFGENITVEGLNEKEIQIGDIFYLGDCRVRVTQPRQPCFKLGLRFGSQTIVKAFSQAPFPGVYVSVIEEGTVKIGDNFSLSERLHDTIGLLDVYELIYTKTPNQEALDFALDFQFLPENVKETLRKRFC
jgi:MOSC domain-containing protein YiiM